MTKETFTTLEALDARVKELFGREAQCRIHELPDGTRVTSIVSMPRRAPAARWYGIQGHVPHELTSVNVAYGLEYAA